MRFFLMVATALFMNLSSSLVYAFELIGHRGVHQTYNRENLKIDSCTAIRIENTGHLFLENTIESIERTFELGASMVELDIHPTTESAGEYNLAVFHDWTLNCRTNASCESGCRCNSKNQCVTHDQSMKYLKTLDIGHGYTSDGGKSFPFRGKYFGKISSFREVLEVLKKYPNKKILVNQKDKMNKTVLTFLKIMEKYPVEVRNRVYFPRNIGFDSELEKMAIPESIYQSGKSFKCLKKYLLTGWYGGFPKACHNLKMFIPVRQTLELINPILKTTKLTDLVWGWPHRFIELAHKHGSQVYASQVDSLEELASLKNTDLDGIMTNKFQLIGLKIQSNLPKKTLKN